MIRISVGNTNIASGNMIIPKNGPWVLDARCEDSPGVTVGSPITVKSSDGTILRGELYALELGLNNVSRVRVVVRPIGCGKLSANTSPSCSLNTTVSEQLSQIGALCGVSIKYRGTDTLRRTHVVRLKNRTHYQQIAAITPDNLQHKPDGTIDVGPMISRPNANFFDVQDYSAINKTVQLALRDSFLLWPGDVVNGMILGTIQYHINDNCRAVCEVT